MKAFSKTVLRMFKSNKTRFLANCLIVLLSMIISAGLGALAPIMKDVKINDLNEAKITDVIIKNKSTTGFDDKLLDVIKDNENVESIDSFFNADFEQKTLLDDRFITRFYAMTFKDKEFNNLDLIEGSYPSSYKECVVEVSNHNTVNYEIGDLIKLSLTLPIGGLQVPLPLEFRVSGIVFNELYMSVSEEPSYLNQEEKVDSIIYTDINLFPPLYKMVFIDTDTIIKLKNPQNYEYFSEEYKNYVSSSISSIEKDLKKANYDLENFVFLDLEQNLSYRMFETHVEKILLISIILPIFFVLVCALVNVITISRLIADERSNIGCYFSQGIEKSKIMNKYMLFSVISTGLGLLIGYPLGYYLVPFIIFPAIGNVYHLSNIIYDSGLLLGLIYTAIIFLVSILITAILVARTLNEIPANLLQAKAPKAGKKILLEKIKPIWHPLPFRIKSSIRNIFRQRKNFILTLLSVIGSTLLMFIGFALFDVSVALIDDPTFSQVASSMKPISLFVVLIAVLLCILVVYNLANMNILERNRELATLKVLGYQDIECSFYTFREILMISVLGIILGIPISYFTCDAVFKFLEFGAIQDVKWYSYIYTILIAFSSTLVINFILYPKVIKVNMNDSLKTLD